MSHPNHKDKTGRFLEDFEETSTTVMLGLMVITLGLYSIIWIYIINNLLDKHDKHAPETSRGISVLAIIPLTWIILTNSIKLLIFDSVPLFYTIFEYIIWAFILFLIYKYLHDFIESFTNITKSQPFMWNSLFGIGLIGLIGLITQQYYLYPFLIGIVFASIGMQSELNTLAKSHSIRKVSSTYYKR